MIANLMEWAFVAIRDMEPLPKHRKRVRKRVALNLCLDNRPKEKGDPEAECDCEAHTRGLCKKHHHKFLWEKQGTDKNEREAYEKKRVLEGTILSDRQGKGGGRPRTKKAKAS